MPHTSSFHFKLENCSPNYLTHAMQALANSRFECPFKPIVRDFSYSKEKEERKNFTQLNSIYIYIHQFGDENQNDRREYLIRRMGTSVGVIARLRRNTHMDYNILFTILPQFNWIQRNFKKNQEREKTESQYIRVYVYAMLWFEAVQKLWSIICRLNHFFCQCCCCGNETHFDVSHELSSLIWSKQNKKK